MLQFRFIISLLTGILFFSCNEKKIVHTYESDFEKELNAFFKDVTTSPLKPDDFKSFQSLPFFPLDSNFMFLATLKKTPKNEFFDMKTNTNRFSKERIFGILTFQIRGYEYRLKIYQSKTSLSNKEKSLFLPFLDKTNGFESYIGGRYLDLKIPNSDTILIDFNEAYNPYCAYNENFSCPIVPRENFLPIKIRAGVMYDKKY